MTAINVFIDHNESHIFADAGHFSGKTLRMIAPKVYPLPRFKAVLAWSGPSFDVDKILSIAEALPTLDALPDAIIALGWTHPFSAIVVQAGSGFAVEQGGVVHRLGPGNVIKSLQTPVQFDPANLRRNAVEMMEDQRARHGVVAGYLQHVTVGRDRITSEILHEWRDLVVIGGGVTTAAKIQDLTVGTINFKPGSVQGYVVSGTSVPVPNAGGFPILMNFIVVIEYYGDAAAAQGNTNYSVVRNRDSKTMAAGVRIYSGTSYRLDTFSGGVYDTSATTSETYTVNAAVNVTSVDPDITHMAVLSKEIMAVYVKK